MSRQSTMKAAFFIWTYCLRKIEIILSAENEVYEQSENSNFGQKWCLYQNANYFFSEYCNLYKQKYGFHEMKIAMWPKGKP